MSEPTGWDDPATYELWQDIPDPEEREFIRQLINATPGLTLSRGPDGRLLVHGIMIDMIDEQTDD